MELDMTKGKPMMLILKFLIPVTLGNIFQQLYNTVDSIIVGQFVGVDAFAAVGSTGTINFMLLGFLSGMTAGFTVIVSQYYGIGDIKSVKKATFNGIVLAGIISLVLTALSIYFMKDLFRIMNMPENIWNDAYRYIFVICAGIVCSVLYNMMSSLMRAVGDSKSPLYFLGVSVVLNCVLDLVFIICLKMGVVGAALATVISQGVSGLLCVVYIYVKMPVLQPQKDDMRIVGNIVRKQLAVGIPMALQFSITAVGTCILQAALNLLGSLAVAAYSAAVKIEIVITQPFAALGVTMATYSAQNRGIGDIDRINKGVKSANIVSGIYAVAIGILMFTLLGSCISLFVPKESVAEVKDLALIYMRIAACCYIFLGIIFIYRNTLQGAGLAFLPMLAGVIELACRCIFSLIAAKERSFTGICIANMSAWIGAAVFLMLVYVFKLKHAKFDKIK